MSTLSEIVAQLKVNYPKRSANPVTLPMYQLSADEYNLVVQALDAIVNNGAGTIDSELSEASENALQNKVVTAALKTKFAGISFVEGVLHLYADEAKTVELGSVTLGATSYVVSQNCDHESGFYVLTGEEQHIVTVTPTTLSSVFGSQASFLENYTIVVAVKNGTGTYETMIDTTVQAGKSYGFDIRNWMVTGDNTVKITITGQSSTVSTEVEYSCILTNLTFSCDFSWWRAWVGGNTFGVDGIYFYGNLAKTLYVRIDRDDDLKFSQVFSASTNYRTSSYTFNISERWTTLTTGIHTVEIWLEGGGASTSIITYSVMVVTAADASTAKLVVINNAQDTAKNYASTTSLFQYATYNTTSITADVFATDGENNFTIADGATLSGISTQTATDYPVSLAMESYVQTSAFVLTALLTTPDNHTDSHTFPVDNSESYAPTTDALVYFNLAARSNSESNKTTFINDADNAAAASYAGTFTNFAWNNDGYTTDSDGNMGLKVAAGSSVSIKTLFPLVNTQTRSTTIEFMYRASNIADYDTPIFSIMSTQSYNENTTNGIILFPTQLKVLSSAERRHTFQSYNLSEDDILHVTIVFHRNYSGKSQHICRIYVNGCNVTNFEFSGTSVFSGDYSYIKMGQDSADLMLYMFRYYEKALEPSDVLSNFLNAIIENNEYSRSGLRNDNGIVDGGSISYELAKQKGFNCYVVETDEELPSFNNNTTLSGVNVRFEYGDHPEWNVRIVGIPMDGQGTTSKQYYRWNLRNKIKSASTQWQYLNLTDSNGDMLVETGKDGYIAGYGLHPKVSKITAKKNIASSSQGHKMGATNMYNDLWHKFFDSNLGTTHYIPSEDIRVAVYQYPFLGFRMTSDGGYEFIGLYTSGPDKTDKKTFGYNQTSTYPSLMMIEGPNHAPRMTRFLCPWTEDVAYNHSNETLECGGQEGWDADIAADYSTDDASDESAIQALYESEFKPAYDFIFYTSPYIRPLSATGYTISQINADIDTFWAGTTSGYSNILLTLYDSSYNLYYYRIKTGQYEALGVNIKTYLGAYLSATSPTEAQIQAACEAKFKAEINNYVSIDEALFHRCYTEIIGASDNDAKNTYWRKFLALASGGKWGFQQDDLDTILPSDNNGQSTKSYSIEPGDVTGNGDEVFQGQTSAFWERIRISYTDQLRSVMVTLVDYMDDIASEHSLTGSTLHERILKVFSYYFWDSASKYFPALAYAEDTEFGYLTPWVEDHTKTYNSVEPLTQALGTQYNAELIWVERRIAYIFSKYRIGGFGSATGEYGQLSFTPSASNAASFNVVPAIDIYPRESKGGAEPEQGARTSAGSTCVIAPSSDGATTFYLLGLNLYSYLGDLSQLVLTSRGGSSDTAITFEVSAERLRELKVGGTGTVLFNATTLNVSSKALERIDARNATSIQGTQDLTHCPRLKYAYFSGTRIVLLQLPIGGKVRRISLPSTITTLFLYSLPLLTTSNISIDSYASVVSLYVNDCAKINPITLARACYNAGNRLKYVSMYWEGSVSGQSSDVEMIAYMAAHIYNSSTGNGYGSVVYDSANNTLTNVGDKPIIEGTLNIANGSATRENVALINSVFPNLTLTGITEYFITFADPEALDVMRTICGDGTGITESQAAALTSMGTLEDSAISVFWHNTVVETFDEFVYFTGITTIPARLFEGCTSLTSVVLPNGITGAWSRTFEGCTSLMSVTFPNDLATPTSNDNVFYGCTSLVSVTLPASWTYISHQMFAGCTSLDMTIPSTVTRIGFRAFADSGIRAGKLVSADDGEGIYWNCTRLTAVTFYSGIATIPSATFGGCTSLALTSLPSTITEIGAQAFSNCTSLALASLPSGLTTLGTDAFYACRNITITSIPSGVTSIPTRCFYKCSSMNITALSNNVTFIGEAAFQESGISIGTWPTGMNAVTKIEDYCFYSTGVTFSGVPSGVTEIGAYAFAYCNGITSFTLGNNITTIGKGAFAHCTNLSSVTLPSNLTEIVDYLFDTAGLTGSLTIPSRVTKIGRSAFCNLTATITSLPNGLVEVGSYAFGETATFTGTLPSSVTKVGGSAFVRSGLSGEIGTNLTNIGEYAFTSSRITRAHLGSGLLECDSALQQCNYLTEIIMEASSVTELVPRFAWGCNNLATVDLPNNITVIGAQAFARDSGVVITTVNLRVTDPSTLTMGTGAFLSGQTIHVPSGTASAYAARFSDYTFVDDL